MKKLILVILLGLTVVSFSIFYILTQKIIEGNVAILEGKKQITAGEMMLAHGKQKLMRGKQELLHAKKIDSFFQSIPLMSVAEKIPIGGVILDIPNKKIAAGDFKVNQGEQRLKKGEEQLVIGKIQLQNGIARLNQVNLIRFICGGIGFFTGVLFILLFWYWHKTGGFTIKTRV